ncbi:uncharacterized protein NDAI_0E04710 [Naumovozyma dairenensis CBS 421]|uniref:Uncharacterized protein n=1 Tax=Naumovozyma dairenensis (strain ATCC 10597 / BCRC 20456 / CBS 421 / NBRC 0211 / NRRL Y-12639) TaxID=1071378 RepID=G0WAL5_NAUDC|nr:hypothetical protein NDAI_0E04710 [Naumovozyma dairenensis CBS 421]CCD25288.1 hypothetical protein NDAI_0E04710 [Naumovozyma dairenensis CBS 421]
MSSPDQDTPTNKDGRAPITKTRRSERQRTMPLSSSPNSSLSSTSDSSTSSFISHSRSEFLSPITTPLRQSQQQRQDSSNITQSTTATSDSTTTPIKVSSLIHNHFEKRKRQRIESGDDPDPDVLLKNMITTVDEITQLAATICRQNNVLIDDFPRSTSTPQRTRKRNLEDKNTSKSIRYAEKEEEEEEEDSDYITVKEINELLVFSKKIKKEEIFKRIDQLVAKSEKLRLVREQKRQIENKDQSKNINKRNYSNNKVDQLIQCLKQHEDD